MSHRVPETLCLECGKPLDAATDVYGDDRPSPGDISLCVYCGNLSAYGDDLKLRPLSEDERIDVEDDVYLMRLRAHLRGAPKPDA